MSDRSSQWYADSGNRERRKVRMRAYQSALVALGQAHPAERLRIRQEARAEGLGHREAGSRVARMLREAHPSEFRDLFEEKLRAAQGSGPQPA